MKNRIYTLVFSFILMTTMAFAQTPYQRKARQVEAIKIGYLTRRLDLTPAESQKFWPVYNQYQNELLEINRQKKQIRIQNANDDEKLVDDDFKFDTKILDIKKKYRNEFRKILSAEKVKSLYLAERDFREELIRQLKNRREEN